MIKKCGITVTTMVITIIILIILAGVVTVSMYSTINYSNVVTWSNEIMYIQEVVDEELNNSSILEYTLGNITIDTTNINQEILNQQFKGENILADNTISLIILNLGKLRIVNTKYGNSNTPTDVYAFSEETGRVYYVSGIEADGYTYYSLTDTLKNRYGLTTSHNNLTSVVFIPSVIGYTNNPVSLTVKVPNSYSNIVISTSNDEIQISSQIVEEKVYVYNVNSNLVTGNYTVTVSYNDGVQTKTSKFEVSGYDVNAPVITEITKDNFVYKEGDQTILDYVMNITATDESGIRIMKYAVGTITQENAKEYFKQNGNQIIDGKINLDRVSNIYTIYVEDNAGNYSVLTFNRIDYIEWVSSVVDEVPIPKGFVASEAEGENTKEKGLVIYEGSVSVTDTNVEQAKRTRNQYVWVPVDDFNKFVRNNFNMDYTWADTLGETSKYWEVELDSNNLVNSTQSSTLYMSKDTLKEVQAMYASVKKYGGFYIARYEAGIDSQRTSNNYLNSSGNILFENNLYSVMGKIAYTYIPWGKTMVDETGGAVQEARSIYPITDTSRRYGVVSTLTYGVQWDAILQWCLDSNIITSVTDSNEYGNYNDTNIEAGKLNAESQYATFSDNIDIYNKTTSTVSKGLGTSWALSTGALENFKLNNIYDIAGNFREWTMEGYSTDSRVARGGSFHEMGATASDYPVAYRYAVANPSTVAYDLTFRVALYVK